MLGLEYEFQQVGNFLVEEKSSTCIYVYPYIHACIFLTRTRTRAQIHTHTHTYTTHRAASSGAQCATSRTHISHEHASSAPLISTPHQHALSRPPTHTQSPKLPIIESPSSWVWRSVRNSRGGSPRTGCHGQNNPPPTDRHKPRAEPPDPSLHSPSTHPPLTLHSPSTHPPPFFPHLFFSPWTTLRVFTHTSIATRSIAPPPPIPPAATPPTPPPLHSLRPPVLPMARRGASLAFATIRGRYWYK